jgi:peptidyl-tRNA hydrolase, PTH2 family
MSSSATSSSATVAPEPPTPAMYLIVNTDLKMGKGKIASQCAHAAADLVLSMAVSPKKTPKAFDVWLRNGTKKIVLKAPQAILEALVAKYDKTMRLRSVIDAGFTQIEPGSFTVLGFEPLFPQDAPLELLELKLL